MRRILILLILLGLTAGCGYHFAGGGTAPGGIKKIAILVAKNSTSEPGIEDTLTRAIIDEFIADGRIRVTAEENSDAVLYSNVISFETVAVSAVGERGEDYTVKMKVDFRLEDKEKKVLWKESGMESNLRADYKASTDVSSTRIAKEKAISKYCKNIARDLISSMFEGF
ncbi:MAG: LPS assembly lipoprotein LptE [Nitrospirota bacterium]